MYQRILAFWRSSPKADTVFLGLMLLFQLAVHAPMLHQSPRGMHVWRQVVGHAAVQNYREEDARFWHPRSDIRLYPGDTGEVYHELPLTYWLAAKATDLGWTDAWTAANSIQLLFNLIMIPGAFYFLIALGAGRNRAALFTFLIGFSPLYLFYAPLLEPNLLGLSFFLAALALYLPAVDAGRYGKRFWAGTWLLLLATLAKPTYLFFGLPVAAWIVPALWRQRSLRAFASVAASGLLLLLGNALVLRHAKAVYLASPYQRQFHTPIASPGIPHDINLIWQNVSKALTTWFLEMNLNLAAIPLLLVALIYIYNHQTEDKRLRNFWLAWTASLCIFCTLFVVRLADHDYYIASALPLAAWLSSLGARRWIQSGRQMALLAFIMVVAIPYIGITRAYGRYLGKPQIPDSILQHAEEISAGIPKDELILVDGDKTPIVFLYYLKRKGLSISQVDGPMQPAELLPFRWLVRYEGSKVLSPRTQLLKLGPAKKVFDFTISPILGIEDAKKAE